MIKQRILEVRERIERACERAGRSSDSVTLVAVSKNFDLRAIEEAYEAGVRHFGENRVQELKSKTEELPGYSMGGTVYWHMIGHVQRNKAKDVVRMADIVHSVDSLRLAKELDNRASMQGTTLPCMVQVNVSGEASKFGLEPVDLVPFMENMISFDHLDVQGLMGMAAPAENPETIRPQFKHLCRLREELVGLDPKCAGVRQLSMGMSSDFEVAIEEGATHVRIGSLIFGSRN